MTENDNCIPDKCNESSFELEVNHNKRSSIFHNHRNLFAFKKSKSVPNLAKKTKSKKTKVKYHKSKILKLNKVNIMNKKSKLMTNYSMYILKKKSNMNQKMKQI